MSSLLAKLKQLATFSRELKVSIEQRTLQQDLDAYKAYMMLLYHKNHRHLPLSDRPALRTRSKEERDASTNFNSRRHRRMAQRLAAVQVAELLRCLHELPLERRLALDPFPEEAAATAPPRRLPEGEEERAREKERRDQILCDRLLRLGERVEREFPHPSGHFSVQLRTSTIPHPDSGLGVYIKGHAIPGTVLGFYGGVTHLPHRLTRGVREGNAHYYYVRRDNLLVDGREWERLNMRIRNGEDPLDVLGHERRSSAIDTDSTTALLKFRNPFAIGQYINHAPGERRPNAMCYQFDFTSKAPLSKELLAYAPNIYSSPPSLFDRVILGGGGPLSLLSLLSQKNNLLRQGAIVIATSHIRDEEVFLNYGLNPNNEEWPEWYVDPDPEATKRLWAKLPHHEWMQKAVQRQLDGGKIDEQAKGNEGKEAEMKKED
ncbi:hypothetical protein QOT17_009420 [Balamuthia mandrillaris]